MKKKFLSILLAAGVCALGLVGCSGTPSASPAASTTPLETGQADKTIVVGYQKANWPMTYEENGQVQGMDAELAKAAAQKMGYAVEFKAIDDWGSVQQLLDSGSVDLVWSSMSVTPEREAGMLFTKPYLKNRQALVVKADSDIQTIADIEGKIVGAYEGSTNLAGIRAKAEIADKAKQIVVAKDLADLYAKLEDGSVDVAAIDSALSLPKIKQGAPLRLLEESVAQDTFAVAVKKGNTQLLDALQAALDQLDAQGTIRSLSEQTFGEDLSIPMH